MSATKTPKVVDIPNSSQRKNRSSVRATWQIPSGVSPGTWDYVRNAGIAKDYDQFLKNDPLTTLDWQIVSDCLPPVGGADGSRRPVVIEFGCGTGRTLIPLVERGYGAIGVDLSRPMLEQMQQNFSSKFGAEVDRERLVAVEGNLVELDFLASNSVAHGVCLFSTLGMIRGQKYRRQFLGHARRVIKDGGVFVLHAHNLWHQVKLPGGLKWLGGHCVDVVRGKCELGDRFSMYRNVSDMFIHSFRKRELKQAMEEAGFKVEQWHRVEDRQPGRTPVGWVIVCR